MEGEVFEKADLEADGDDLAEVSGRGAILARGAEVGEAEVAGAGEFEARGDYGGVKVEDGAELNLETELHGAGGECFAVEHPAATVGKPRGEDGEETVSFFVAEALNIERLHCLR